MMLYGLIVLVLGSTTLFPMFFTFDRLVRRQHDLHPEAWQAAGCPDGIFWHPPGLTYWRRLRSSLATNKCMLIWPLRTPPWIQSDPEAARLLKRLRILALACLIAATILSVALSCGLFFAVSQSPGVVR